VTRFPSLLHAVLVTARSYGDRPLLSPASALRVGLWTLAFLFLMPHLLPARWHAIPPRNLLVPVDKLRVHAMGAEDFESGAWSTVPAKAPREFRIAWIGASNDLILTAREEWVTLVPQLVQQRLATTATRNVFMLSYQLTAGALLDKHLAFVHALDQEPDVVVFSVNPIWDFSPVIRTARPGLRALGLPHLPAEAGTWGRFVLFATPRDLASAALLRAFPAVHGASRRLHQRWLDPFHARRLSHRLGGEPVTVVPRRNVMKTDFWLMYQKGLYPESHLHRQKLLLRHYFDASADSEGLDVMRAVRDEAAARNVPLVLFTAALNPELTNAPGIARRLGEMESVLRPLAAGGQGQVTYWELHNLPWLTPVDFYDGIHLTRGDAFADLLAERLRQRFPEALGAVRATEATP
jgi:hypothetical protein